jgi:predicted dehydrogenase
MKSVIIGGGFIASKHKEAILKMGWEYMGCYDVVPERSELTLKQVQEADIVHICTPTLFHHTYLPKWKQIVIEKPVAISSKLVPDRDACVVYQRRWDDQAIQMKEFCNFIRPERIICNILVPRDAHYWECWRGDPAYSGGGALMNIGIHYLDLLQWWLKCDYTIKEAQLGYFGRVVEESAHIVFDFNGTEVIFDLNARHHRRKVEFIASRSADHFVYNIENATHYDVLKHWQEGKYVDPEEAKKSLMMVEDIYDYCNKSNIEGKGIPEIGGESPKQADIPKI